MPSFWKRFAIRLLSKFTARGAHAGCGGRHPTHHGQHARHPQHGSFAGRRLAAAFFAATLGTACSAARGHGHGQHQPGEMHHAFTNAEEWAKTFDDPARDAWQRPDEVVRTLELAEDHTVADLGAGTGYFTVRLARAVPRGTVIATDIEPDMLRYLEQRAQKEQLPNVRTLKGSATGSGLSPKSVDRILIVHVWHHLEDRATWARDLAAALRPGGKLVIVDFRLDATRGPPPKHRLAAETIVKELEAAGLRASVSPAVLPDQYAVEARPSP